MSTTQTTTVDDTDVQHILYTGDAWYPGGNSSSDYMGTLHNTNSVGNGFTYTFHGTNISVFGTLARSVKGALISSYSLDNGTVTTYNATPGLASNLYHQKFYSSPIVEDGEHTLTMHIDSLGPDATYQLDFLQYSVVPPPVTSAAVPEVSSTAAPSTTALSSSSRSGPPLKVLLPAIIVPVVFFLLFLLLAVGWFVKKRNAEWRQSISDIGHEAAQKPAASQSRTRLGGVTPYSLEYSSERGTGDAPEEGEAFSQDHGGARISDYETAMGHSTVMGHSTLTFGTTVTSAPMSSSPPTTIASRILHIHGDVPPEAHPLDSPKDVPPAYTRC